MIGTENLHYLKIQVIQQISNLYKPVLKCVQIDVKNTDILNHDFL